MTFVSGQRAAAPWSNHNWHGQWSTAAQLPNVAGATSQISDLQAGDKAWVVAASAEYICTDPTAGAAVWVAVPTGAADCCDQVPLVYQPGGTAAGNVYTDFGLLHTAANTRENPVVLIDGTFLSPTIPAGTYDFSGWTFRSAGIEQAQLVFMDGVNATITAGYLPVAFDNLAVALDAGNMTASPFRLVPTNYSSALTVDATNTTFVGDSVSVTPVGVFHLEPTGTGDSTLNVTVRGISNAGDYTVVTDNTAGIVNVGLTAYDVGTVQGQAIVGTASNLNRAVYSAYASLAAQSLLTVTVTDALDAAAGTKERHVLNGTQTGVVELLIGSLYFVQGTVILAGSKAMIGTVAGGAETATLNMRAFTGGALVADWAATGALQDVGLAADVTIAASGWYDLFIVGGGGGQVAQARGLYLTLYLPGGGG